MPKPKRIVDEVYLDFVRDRRCTVPGCYSEKSDPHHVISRGAGGSDYTTVPLCREHHNEVHQHGRARFQTDTGLDLWRAVARLLALYIEKQTERIEELEANDLVESQLKEIQRLNDRIEAAGGGNLGRRVRVSVPGPDASSCRAIFDSTGTHMLVPRETWERACEELLGASRSMLACAGILGDDSLTPRERIDDARPYIASRSGVVRRALEEIGGER
jgi:hypothetical protein